jgi:ubiquinone/menaquinone biosynthesis C-methylase UbiE
MRGVEPLRSELLRGVRGRVLELGFGTGSNLPHYPATATRPEAGTGLITELVGVEPAEGLAQLAKERMSAWSAETGIATRVEVASGSRPLPFDPASFDTVVITFVLCSVRDPRAMLDEARRLLAPGGSLVVAEHVGAPRGLRRTAQRAIRPAWRALLGGCDPLGDARGALEQAGFDTSELEDRPIDLPWIVATGLVGRARPR